MVFLIYVYLMIGTILVIKRITPMNIAIIIYNYDKNVGDWGNRETVNGRIIFIATMFIALIISVLIAPICALNKMHD